jgi:type II secretory pathway predicted ATPase ExeA
MNPGSIHTIEEVAPHLGSGDHAESTDSVEKMFLEYYGLAEQPFGVTPDPRFLYLGSKHREALTALDYGTKTNRGFLALIAKPGMGKTSLLFQYLESLGDKARTALVFQTDGDSRDLMRYLLADVGLDGKGKDLPEMRSMLNEVLLEEMRAGRRFILVIDEAQNLGEEALESVRLLSNFETPGKKLMQIVLAGQPQLAERLASTSLAQLRQRISFFIRIEPFTQEETDAYIDHRLGVVGYRGPQMFTAGARRLIAEQSEGVPRMINNICFSAMSLGWALKRKTIDQEMIGDVLAELNPVLQNERAAVISQSKPEIESKHAASQLSLHESGLARVRKVASIGRRRCASARAQLFSRIRSAVIHGFHVVRPAHKSVGRDGFRESVPTALLLQFTGRFRRFASLLCRGERLG